MPYPRRRVSVFPIRRSPRTSLSHDLFTTMSFWTDPRSQAKRNSRKRDMDNVKSLIHFLKKGNVRTALIKHQNQGMRGDGAKQKWQRVCYNKSFLQNCLQLHCLNSTLGNSELLTWPSYVHGPPWRAGEKPHRHFMASECRSNGTKMKLQDPCEVIKQEMFPNEWWKIAFISVLCRYLPTYTAL